MPHWDRKVAIWDRKVATRCDLPIPWGRRGAGVRLSAARVAKATHPDSAGGLSVAGGWRMIRSARNGDGTTDSRRPDRIGASSFWL